MKQLISVLIVFQILGSCVFAAQEPYAQTIVNETFDGYATNAEYENAFGAYGTRIIEEGGSKKLLIKADGNGAALEIEATLPQTFIVSMDIEVTGRLESAVYMSFKDASGKSTALLRAENGELLRGDGKRAVNLMTGIGSVNLTYKINLNKKKYSVYSNGNQRISDWKTTLANPKKMVLEFVGSDESPAEIKIDNLRIYEGTEILTKFEPQEYNDEEFFFDPEYVEEETEAEVYYGNTFEGKTDIASAGISTVQIKNESEALLEKNGENTYITLKRKEADPYFDFNVDPTSIYYVIQTDVMVSEFGAKILLFHLKSASAQFNELVGINASGAVTTPKGGTVGTVARGQWYTISCVVNSRRKLYDVYINGELAKEKISFTNEAFSSPQLVRFTFSGGAGNATVSLDNFFVYSGKTVNTDMSNVEVAQKKVFTDNETIEKSMKGCAAFTVYNGAAFIKDKKVFLENKPFEENGKLYAPAEFYEKAYDAVIKKEGETAYINDTAVSFTEKESAIYFDFEEVAKNAVVQNYFVDTERGFAIMGSKSFAAYKDDKTDYNGNNYLVLSRGEKRYIDLVYYLLYERPSAETIIEKFKETSAGQHPRIMGRKEDFDRIREEIKTDPIKAKWAESFIKSADGLLESRTMPVYELHDGERLATPSLNSLWTLAFAYQLTGDGKYCDSIYEEVLILRDFPDWHPMHFLDTAGNSAAVAVAYDWCYDYWSEEQRANIRDALYRHGLHTGYTDLYGGATSKWTAWNNNWAAVCWGSLGLAAIALMDDYEQEAAEVLEGGLHGLGYMLPMFAPDGAWAEGLSYWNYCLTWFTRHMATLESALGTNFGYVDQEGIRETMLYPYTLNGSVGMFNFHDADASGGINTAPNAYLADHFGDYTIKQLRMNEISTGTIDDFFFGDTSVNGLPENLPLDFSYGLTETGSMRSAWFEKGATFVGYHCSPNSPVHRNFDSGTFIFDSMGVRWATELGGDSYVLPGYWAENNNPIYRVRTEGQNCYVINPGAGSGQRFESEDKIIKTESMPRAAYAVMDITDAYKDDVTKALRGVMLGDNRQTMTVRDEIDFKKESDFYWFMHTRADVEITGANTAVLSSGAQMNFEFISNQPLTIEVMDAVPLDTSVSPQNTENKGIRKIVLKGKVKGHLDLTVKMTPSSIAGVTVLENTPINEWTLPDGEMPQKPYLNGIYADGELIAGFEPTTSRYVLLKSETHPYPEITVNANENIICTIDNISDGIYQITVSDANDAYNVSGYTIVVKNFVKTPGAEDMKLIYPQKYEASAEPETGNPAVNIMDADASTRWSADGRPTMTYTYAEPITVEAFGIAFYKGKERKSYFEIQISEDGENFTTIKDCAASGTTEDMELYKLDIPVTTKYVRLLGKGNDTNEWFSPTEFYVFSK